MAAGRFVTQLQGLCRCSRQSSRYLLRNGHEVKRDWRPSWSCDAVTSTPALLRPYRLARTALLIEPAASQSLVGIDWVAVSIISYSPRPSSSSCPTPWLRPLLVIYLLWAFLIWAWVAHHGSQGVCLCEWKLLSLTRGFMDFWHCACASKQRVEDKNCLIPAESHPNERHLPPKHAGTCSHSIYLSIYLLFFLQDRLKDSFLPWFSNYLSFQSCECSSVCVCSVKLKM